MSMKYLNVGFIREHDELKNDSKDAETPLGLFSATRTRNKSLFMYPAYPTLLYSAIAAIADYTPRDLYF